MDSAWHLINPQVVKLGGENCDLLNYKGAHSGKKSLIEKHQNFLQSLFTVFFFPFGGGVCACVFSHFF